MKRILLYASTMFLTGLFVMSSVPTVKADPYGTAGCGLGSMLFEDDAGLVQVLAATTNGTFANQTFAISSGTSNCEDTSGGNASTKAFIETNREAFAKDTSRGYGETIISLSSLAGCSDDHAVGAALQSEFKTIFPNSEVSDTQVSQKVLETLKKHSELSCDLLS